MILFSTIVAQLKGSENPYKIVRYCNVVPVFFLTCCQKDQKKSMCGGIYLQMSMFEEF